MNRFPPHIRQFLVFITGGALCALIDVGLLQAMILAGSTAMLATSAGFVAGLGVNYAFHAKITFKQLSSHGTVARYLCVVALNYLLTLGCVSAALALGASALVGKLLSLPLVAVNGFLLSKHWIFK